MSIFRRIGEIVRSNRPEPPRTSINPYEETRVGDIVAVGLNEYVVSGKVVYFDRGYPPHRYAYYLQDGAEISCLIVEKGRVYECFHCTFLEGGLDTPDDVPTHLEINGSTGYNLEHQRYDLTRTEGNTDFRSGDEVIVWKYFGDGDNSFYLQWQDGKFVALQGERTSNADIKFMKSG